LGLGNADGVLNAVAGGRTQRLWTAWQNAPVGAERDAAGMRYISAGGFPTNEAYVNYVTQPRVLPGQRL